jgi:hypothetical protein
MRRVEKQSLPKEERKQSLWGLIIAKEISIATAPGVATKNSISHSTYEDSQFLFTRYRFSRKLYLVHQSISSKAIAVVKNQDTRLVSLTRCLIDVQGMKEPQAARRSER